MSGRFEVVIVGCGVAGVTAARTIREIDPEVGISIFTDEDHLYYPRPRLYEVLSGEARPQEIYMLSRKWYEEKCIKAYLNKKVVDIETGRKEIFLQDHSKISYDKLLLANGAHPFVPPIKGVEKNGVFTLRSMIDALAIKEYAKETRKAIIIGGGLLGLEFAESLRKLGQQVVVMEISPRLCPRQLDQEGANILKDRIERRGIDVMLGVKTEEILGDKMVSGILLDNGKEFPGSLILISAGVRPNTNLAAEAEIDVNRGVLVDQYLQTNVDDIYASGDVAEYRGRLYGIIPAAMEQAKIAATNMMKNGKQVYRGTAPSTTLKIVGIDLTSIGLVNPEDSKYEEVKKIDEDRQVYKKIILKQGKIVGAIILGETKGVVAIKKLIDHEMDVTKYKDFFLDDNFEYRKILS